MVNRSVKGVNTQVSPAFPLRHVASCVVALRRIVFLARSVGRPDRVDWDTRSGRTRGAGMPWTVKTKVFIFL